MILIKTTLFILGFLSLFSCNVNSDVSQHKKRIEISDSLKIVIENYKNEYLSNHDHMEGTIGIKLYPFCESNVLKIYNIRHWIDFNVGYPNFYSYHEDIPILIFTGMEEKNGLPEMDSVEIRDVLKSISIIGLSLPPKSGFYPMWLYRQDYESNNIFSVVDSLFKFDDRKLLKIKMNEYTGSVFCY